MGRMHPERVDAALNDTKATIGRSHFISITSEATGFNLALGAIRLIKDCDCETGVNRLVLRRFKNGIIRGLFGFLLSLLVNLMNHNHNLALKNDVKSRGEIKRQLNATIFKCALRPTPSADHFFLHTHFPLPCFLRRLVVIIAPKVDAQLRDRLHFPLYVMRAACILFPANPFVRKKTPFHIPNKKAPESSKDAKFIAINACGV